MFVLGNMYQGNLAEIKHYYYSIHITKYENILGKSLFLIRAKTNYKVSVVKSKFLNLML